MPLHLCPEFIEQFSKIQEKIQQWKKSYVEVITRLKGIDNKEDDSDGEMKQGEIGEEYYDQDDDFNEVDIDQDDDPDEDDLDEDYLEKQEDEQYHNNEESDAEMIEY